MTDELTKKFFDTFGIEPKIIDTAIGRDFYIEHDRVDKYPQITDRILLELEAIIHNEYNILIYEKFMNSIKITAYPMNDNLLCAPAYCTVTVQADNKREALLVLAMDINVRHYIKQQVRTLFKGYNYGIKS